MIESSFETVLMPREASRRYRTAISTELPDGLPRILREADTKLRALRHDVGRFVRTLPGRPAEASWLYIPADQVLRDHASSVEQELRHALRSAEELADGLALDRPDRRESEMTEPLAFVPLSADVAPQMTLFGGPAPAPAPTSPAAGAAPEPEHRPAFERRAMLRNERHRLVSEVRRRDGASHQEINGWLNRKLGIASVDRATLEDLERSVDLLVSQLTRRH